MIPRVEKKAEVIEDFYAFRVGAMWRYFKSQHYSFWMICCYLFFEFVRPQSIFPQLDILPYAQLFLLGALVGSFADPTVKWVSSLGNKLIIFFFITLVISIFTAIYPEVSKKHFMDFFGWFIIYFLVINIVNTKERFYLFLMVFLVASAKIAFGTSKAWISRGFAYAGWGLMGPPGFFQNSGELAILMLMLFPLAFYMYQGLKDKIKPWEKWLLVLFWVSPILTILGASSRGSQIGLVVQLIIMFRKSLFRPKALIGVVVLCTSLFYLLPEEQKQRFQNTGDDKTSQQRILYWQHGWEMMKEYPVVGVGFFNFVPYYERHFPQDMLYDAAQLPHNIFIQVGTDAGFLATFLFGSIILHCLINAVLIVKDKDNEHLIRLMGAGLGCGVLGFFIAGQFVTVGYYPFLWIHFAFIVALKNICVQRKNASLRKG